MSLHSVIKRGIDGDRSPGKGNDSEFARQQLAWKLRRDQKI